MRFLSTFTLLCLTLFFFASSSHVLADEDSSSEFDEDYTKVTYNSAIKLSHKGSGGFKLHSHGIKWGSGSGQQSVTLVEQEDDPNSLWQIREKFGEQPNPSGTPVKCDDIIRLQHVQTKRWLHSHLHTSPLSHRQEVSGYGEDGGVGSDSGDNWKLICADSKEKFWKRGVISHKAANIVLQHVDTGAYLYTRRADMFDQMNCRGCPIQGQLEASAHKNPNNVLSDANAQWATDDGVFFPVQADQKE